MGLISNMKDIQTQGKTFGLSIRTVNQLQR